MNRDTYSYIRLFRAPSSPALNISKDRAFTASPGNLCQCLTILIGYKEKGFYNLNLPSFSLKSFPLVLSQQTMLKKKSVSLFPTAPPLDTDRSLSGLPKAFSSPG